MTRRNKFNELFDEFKALKIKLFKDNMIVILDEESEDSKRYDQLLQFFYPNFRKNDFVNPMNEQREIDPNHERDVERENDEARFEEKMNEYFEKEPD